MRLRRGAALVAVGIGVCVPPARAEPLRGAARIEAGSEYDTNAGRVEIVQGAPAPTVVASPLGRLVLQGSLQAFPGDRHELGIGGVAAGKVFMDAAASPEDVLVTQATGHWRLQATDRMSMTAGAGYYEAFQRGRADARDFRSVAPSWRINALTGDHGTASLAAGYRWFTFKRDPDHDFQAPTAAVDYGHLLAAGDDEEAAEWELGAGASAEQRNFHGPRIACTATLNCGPSLDGTGRTDTFVAARLEATRVGGFLVGAGYALHWNRSNSYGESLLRHVGHLRAAVSLPARIYVSGRLEIAYTDFFDRVILGRDAAMQFLTIDDESRNSVRLELTRDLGIHFQLIGRWALYGSALGSPAVEYNRQTATLSVAFTVAR